MKLQLTVAAAAFAVIHAALPAHAQFFREEFNYPDGEINAVSGGVWAHSAGNPLNISNGAAVINQGNLAAGNERASRAIPTPFTTAANSVAYVSLTATWTSLPLTSNGSYFLNLAVNTTDETPFYARLGADRAGAADGKFRVAVANASWSTANSAEFPLDLSLGVAYDIVVRYDLTTRRTTLWVNPTSASDASVTATDGPAGDQLDIGAINLRQGISSGTGAPGVIRIDDLAVGNSFESVTAVPEPVELGIASAGVLGAFALLRRRLGRR